jgi:hypothetical protein
MGYDRCKINNIVTRDFNIVKSHQRDINLREKVIKDKTKYTRKMKHKSKSSSYDSA